MTLDLTQLLETLQIARGVMMALSPDAAPHRSAYIETIKQEIGRVTAAIEADKIAPIVQLDGEPRRPCKPDQIRVDRADWNRASGLCECLVCGCPYYDHPNVRGYEWLTRLCDGRLVKL